MKLVTFGEDKGKVGVLDGDEIAVLDVPTMREWFERGGADETGERVPLAETRLRAPVPVALAVRSTAPARVQ